MSSLDRLEIIDNCGKVHKFVAKKGLFSSEKITHKLVDGQHIVEVSGAWENKRYIIPAQSDECPRTQIQISDGCNKK